MTGSALLRGRLGGGLLAALISARAVSTCYGTGLPEADLQFLRAMAVDVIHASSVEPGSNGGGQWPLTNSCGFTLVTPGKDTYTAFWIRDFSMAADSGLIGPAELLKHLELVCRTQNGSTELKLAHGLHVPAWAIPDHINYNGGASFYPGTYSSGQDQGSGSFGRLPPVDDHYEFIHLAYLYWRQTQDPQPLKLPINGVPVFERLERAFDCPTVDPATGLVETTENDRAVGFGFCDAEVHTGKLLFASLLRYRAAGELAQMARALNRDEAAARLDQAQAAIRESIPVYFRNAGVIGGWLRASTGLSGQADVWGTLFALHLRVLSPADAANARRTIAAAVIAGTIALEGGVRHVPTNLDFSRTTAWERSLVPVNLYQNGGYWHTASGWLIEALWDSNRALAQKLFADMIHHLRDQDYRRGRGHGAPWEVFGTSRRARQNAVYMASVALPYSILKAL